MSNNKFLIFTSCGDNSNVSSWLNSSPQYDVWCCYYGNNDFEYKDLIKHYSVRKGGKFQNLFYLFNKHPKIFEAYSSVLIMDDDIIISTEGLNALFEMHKELDLELLQPAFDKTGKISHSITARQPFTKLRYTNFIEVTAPIFSNKALNDFMQVYDPIVNATAVDWWFCTNVGLKDKKHQSIAICDSIWCVNPHDQDKSVDGVREIDRLLSNEERIRTWKKVKEIHKLDYIKENIFITYKSVYGFNFKQIISFFTSYPLNIFYRFNRKVKLSLKN